MSGLIDKIKSLFTSERADQAADQVERNVTDERINQATGRVPGGERAAEHIPDNAGEQAADKIRESGDAMDDDEKEN